MESTGLSEKGLAKAGVTSESVEIILCGTGTSHGIPVIGCRCPVCLSDDPRNKRLRTGVLIRTKSGEILIDTPPDLRQQLLSAKADNVKAVIYTHQHADHLFGIDDLRIFCHQLPFALPLYCEERVEQAIKQMCPYAFSPPNENMHSGAVPQLECKSITTESFSALEVPIQPVRLFHGELPVLGFRIGNFAFCTDCNSIPKESMPLLAGLDVLILDALRYRNHPTHFSVSEALEVVEQLKPKETYFTHICHDIDHETLEAELPVGVKLAYDGITFDIPYPSI